MSDFALYTTDLLRHLQAPPPAKSGTLVRLVGLRMETRGIMAPLGALCEVRGQSGQTVEAEVVGFHEKTLFLMPYSEPAGISPGAQVRVISHSARVRLGPALLGRLWMVEASHSMGAPCPIVPK